MFTQEFFEAKYKMKTSVGRLTSGDVTFLFPGTRRRGTPSYRRV